MIEIQPQEPVKDKRNLSTKWLLLSDCENADTTFLHSHDDLPLVIHTSSFIEVFNLARFHQKCQNQVKKIKRR